MFRRVCVLVCVCVCLCVCACVFDEVKILVRPLDKVS